MDAARGTMVAYATAPGSVAADGEGDNGLYTSELLKAMEIPNLPVEAVFKRVRGAVGQKSKGAQIPWEASSLIGDFVFNLQAPPAPAPPPAPPPATAFDARQIDLAYWNAIKDSNDPTAFQEYLNEQPKGNFASLARRRINELTSKTQIAVAPPPAAPPPQQQAPKPTASLSSSEPPPVAVASQTAPPLQEPVAIRPTPPVAVQQATLVPPPAVEKNSAQRPLSSIQRFDGEYRVTLKVTHATSELINRFACKNGDKTVVTIRAGTLVLAYDTNASNTIRGMVGEDGRIEGKSSNASQPTSLTGKIENGRVTGEMWNNLCEFSVSSQNP
jgi:hypothetical protein